MTEVVLSTPHGSRLYGLATPDSDEDSFVVYANAPARRRARFALQEIEGESDVLMTDVSTFFQYARKGVPQYLEAMWSRMCTVDEIAGMRMSFRPDVYATEETYQRTARSFFARADELELEAWSAHARERFDEHEAALARSAKLRRHSYRLCLNLIEMRETGMFDPTTTRDQRRQLARMMHAGGDPAEYMGVAS